MNTLHLTPRQRRLLYTMQYEKGLVSGRRLADLLHVTDRTIRNDIKTINAALAPYHARIVPSKAKGYFFEAEDPDRITKLNSVNKALFVRENRVRYLSLALLNRDEPQNLYDLEDELYVSTTTLAGDLDAFKREYVYRCPFIGLAQEKDFIWIDDTEEKKRILLNILYTKDWNYQSRGNAFYAEEYLPEDLMDYVIRVVSEKIRDAGISLEDPSIVALHVMSAVMIRRCLDGHTLPEETLDEVSGSKQPEDSLVRTVTDSICDELEDHFACPLNRSERKAVYSHIVSSKLRNASLLSFESASRYFDPAIIDAAGCFLNRLNERFMVDLSPDEDFYITLLQFLEFLRTPSFRNGGEIRASRVRRMYAAEAEMAMCMQEIILTLRPELMNETELSYLTLMISGALEYLYAITPSRKLSAVICCHLNLPDTWMLKRKVLGAFSNFLDVKALLPVNLQSSYDFSNCDLVLCTVQKTPSGIDSSKVLLISPFLSPHDMESIRSFVENSRLNGLCRSSCSVQALFENAQCPEDPGITDRFSLIEYLLSISVSDLPETQKASLLQDLLQREATMSFACMDETVLLSSYVPAGKPHISMITLHNRITWNGFRIRKVVLACLPKGEETLIFPIQNYLRGNLP